MASPPEIKTTSPMFGRARLWVKDGGINSFLVLDNLSGNRLYFFGMAIHEPRQSGQKQVSWMLALRPSSFGLVSWHTRGKKS
jgi:hypothetical protein